MSTPTIVVAPAAAAAMIPDSPTAPVPYTATLSPARTPSTFSTEPAPVCTPHPSGPISSTGRSASIRTTLCTEASAWLANDDCPNHRALTCSPWPSTTTGAGSKKLRKANWSHDAG